MAMLGHDAEKSVPAFGKHHAPAAKAFNGPTLIAAQVDAHGLPAELTGAALAGGGPLR